MHELPVKTLDTRFYMYQQNNHDGRYIIDEVVTKYVIIEALDANHANLIAANKGIYFNEVGRWFSTNDDDAKDFIDFDNMDIPRDFDDQPFCIIYEIDGTVTKHN